MQAVSSRHQSQSSLETAVAANSHQRGPAVVPQLPTTPTQPRLPPPGPPDSPDDHDEPAPVPDGYVSRSGRTIKLALAFQPRPWSASNSYNIYY
ncbi:hypothetical protein Pcinc_008381 [Petrolisthes cinctipes]|uniref:Uncharacterized protein n=1 Tax=Petrolisthes cinctipes TaxID=88211 RepID=A0AAE1KVX9_PETCI|nr:hypothetical protein Pcinc_009571 [Petrolisthes cinctipes]KAK3887526.1 hypothetical protein Pcinc_008381 [Petrolisthes cinctipes]